MVEGSGTAADPWQLNSVSDWNTVAASINRQAEDAVYTSAAYYRLTADIDFDNKNLTPISFTADNTIYFEGEFDGAGHKLLNVKIVAPGNPAAYSAPTRARSAIWPSKVRFRPNSRSRAASSA